MPLYRCECCNFFSKLKGDYKRHINTKKHHHNLDTQNPELPNYEGKSQNIPQKSQNIPQKSQNIPLFECEFCKNTFSTFSNKRRHELHRCKENPILIDKILSTKETIIKRLEKDKKKMQNEIEQLLTKVGTVTNNTTHNTNIIVLNNYGKENTEYLKQDNLKNLVDIPYGAIQKIIKNIHFHPKHPENHNVKITNKKQPYALVWNDKIWETRKKKEVLDDLLDKGYNILDNIYVYNESDNQNYKQFQDNYESNSCIKNEIEKETEMLIVNESKKLDL